MEETAKKYKKTDDTQWCRENVSGSFDLVEIRYLASDTFQVVTGTVDLEDYTDSEQEEYVKFYYKDMETLKQEYPNDWRQVLAECIFESTADHELIGFGPFVSENEAEAFADGYIAKQVGKPSQKY